MKEYFENFADFDSKNFDLVSDINNYSVFYDEKILKTPFGEDVSCGDPRLLLHIIFELTMQEVRKDRINSYIIFCYQRDFTEKKNDYVSKNFDDIFNRDYLVRIILNTEDLNDRSKKNKLIDFFEKDKAILNLVMSGAAGINFLLQKFYNNSSGERDGEVDLTPAFKNFAKDIYFNLEDEYKSAANVLSLIHKSGFLLPILLIKGFITVSEYANLIFGYYLSTDNPEMIFSEEDYKEKISLIYNDAQNVKSYLSFIRTEKDNEETIKKFIKRGEGHNLEFKATFRWNIKTGKKDPEIEHSCLKTIAAFLNSSGGDLLIGVKDDGEIEGIETDKFETEDKFLLHIWNMIKETLGREVSSYIRTELYKLKGGTVCKIQSLRSPTPVFLKQKGFDEEFYIRSGPGSVKLSIGNALKYISKRFKGVDSEMI